MEYYTVANWLQFESLCFKLKGNLVLDYFKIRKCSLFKPKQGGSLKNNTLKIIKDKKEDTLISAPIATRNKIFDKSWTIMVKRLSIPASEYKTT